MRLRPERFKKNFHNDKKKTIKYATVESGYVSGRPRLIFDGETVATIKAYPYIRGEPLLPGDRVRVDNGVVMGAIL